MYHILKFYWLKGQGMIDILQFFILSNITINAFKTDKYSTWGLKKLQRSFFWIFNAIFERNFNFEKKFVRITWKCRNFWYFWNFKNEFSAGNRQTLADMWPKGPLSPKFFPKFFLSQSDKNWRFYLKKTTPPKNDMIFWGGSGYLSTFKSAKF